MFNNGEITNKYEKSSDIKRTSYDVKYIREKIFIRRDSILTEMLRMPHLKNIYNFFITVLIILLIHKLLDDITNVGSTSLGLDFVSIAFGKFHIVVIIWTLMQLTTLLPFIGLKFWITKRSKNFVLLWDILAIAMFIILQLGLLIIPIKLVCKYDLPIVSSFVVLLEMVRFLMKTHAFIRSTIPNLLFNSKYEYPKFTTYFYFLFAPTLVYRDEYPRTECTNWSNAVKGILEIIGCILFVNLLCTHFIINAWKDFGLKTLPITQFIKLMFESFLPSFVNNLCGFYLLLHSWHNSTAEILKFGDRQFYLDWWNQSNFGAFYRTWNIIIHDWLHQYIYKDAFRITGNKTIGMIAVMIISAFFHELVIGYALRFFFPCMLIMFGGIGLLTISSSKYLSPTMGNIFIWFSLIVGDGIFWSSYAIEYFSRINCPVVEDTLMNSIIPRSFICHHITFQSD